MMLCQSNGTTQDSIHFIKQPMFWKIHIPFGMHVKHFAPRPNILWSVRHWVYEVLADFLNSNKGLSINFLYLYTSFFASIITFFKAKKTIYIDPTQCL
jgi:hypothetical protein